MGRLIDADLLKECYAGTNALDGKADYMSIRKMIDNQPTAYDVEKVAEEISKRDTTDGTVKVFSGIEVLGIIMKGGVE